MLMIVFLLFLFSLMFDAIPTNRWYLIGCILVENLLMTRVIGHLLWRKMVSSWKTLICIHAIVLCFGGSLTSLTLSTSGKNGNAALLFILTPLWLYSFFFG